MLRPPPDPFRETVVLLLAIPVVLAAAFSPIGSSDELFREQVAPILERHCLRCHDDTERKGRLSLQTVDQARSFGLMAVASSDHPLLKVVTPKNGRAAMPKDGHPLAPHELETLERWVEAGMPWPEAMVLRDAQVDDFDWWSYRQVERPVVPALEGWGRGPIDAFIARKWREEGLGTVGEADRRTLIRRVTFDLTGLPPSVAEVEAFVADPDPNAYERLVDRLLASERYGERWARHWLDVVKYADTAGYDKDKLRPNAWPYRDYVIRSLNEDKPYTRFVQEQIAGDVLFPGEPDGILGLGFIAAGPWDFIGHVEVAEAKIDGKVARNLDRDDMVSNVLNTFCAVTVQCARCHHHKFDPITQQHYYGLQSIFGAVDRAERPYDQDPEVIARRRALEKELKTHRASLSAAEREVTEAGGERWKQLNEAIAGLKGKVGVQKTPEFGYHSEIVAKPTVEKWVQVDLGEVVAIDRVVLHPCHDEYAGIGPGFGFPVRYRVEVSDDGEAWRIVDDRTQQDVPNPALQSVAVADVGAGRFVRVTATHLVERSGDYILALAELRALDTDGQNLARGAAVQSLDSIEAPIRWGRANLTDGRWAQASDPESETQLAAAVAERAELAKQIETPERIARRDEAKEAITVAEKALADLPRGRMVYAATTFFKPEGNFKPTEGKLRPIHVLHRGDVQSPREAAPPGVFPLSAEDSWQFDPSLDEGARRAALAQWLTDEDHPLVWRAIVNRIWQYHFGQGIVATPNDLGRMGAEPTHPELLDWLAVEFRDGGQSFKKLHRSIVTSSVYRQTSAHHDGYAEIDGSNRFLWRMNRRRLSAEEIRDSILAVSGALDLSMGGPGYYLFVLERTEHSPHYEYHKFDPADPNSHRRSIYRFIVRSQPDPWMTTLDCADSSQSTPRRNETLTSLQALSLLNSRFNTTMASRLAERLAPLGGHRDQVREGMRLVVQREPSAEELEDLSAYASEHGVANLARFLFNLSEFVFVD